MDRPEIEQLNTLLQHPFEFFKTLSTLCYGHSDQQAEKLAEFPEEEIPPGEWKTGGETARLIDEAIELWRDPSWPADIQQRLKRLAEP